MEFLERVLDERAGELARSLMELGFTRDEAERFVAHAGPALMQSYAWQADRFRRAGLSTDDVAGDVLAGISGRRLASRLGLSEGKTWAGLRELVPEVVSASRGRGSPGGRWTSGPSRAAPGGNERDESGELDIGFGIRLRRLRLVPAPEMPPGRSTPPIGATHPVFGPLLSAQQ